MVWGATESGFYALDGSFSVCIDFELNVERFSRPLNCVNLCFLGLCASALAFVFWSKSCAELGVVKTTICLYLDNDHSGERIVANIERAVENVWYCHPTEFCIIL